jgi:streptomycin 6-kinase
VSRAPRVPAGLDWWRTQPGGAAWLERLPRLVVECGAQWGLDVGAPFEPDAHRASPTTATVPARPSTGATISWVAPATRADGTPAVLKVSFPEPESEHEAAALRHWDGAGAVRLLAHDPERRALLLERCEPGTPLWALGDEEDANAIAAGVLRALWGAPPPAGGAPFRTLAGEARRWAAEHPGRWERHERPFERSLLDAAVGWIGELLGSPAPPVVLHQDLHGGNVLRAAREPWLAIDPKPLAGEREFDVASLLRDRRPELAVDPAPARRMRRRLDQFAAELDLDRERARRWGVIHALAWGVEADAVRPDIVACAAWLAAA